MIEKFCTFHSILLWRDQSSEEAMRLNLKKSQTEFAKLMAAACVRRGYLEKLHAGFSPVTRSGDYSDVKVVDAEGREIPWNQVSRINQEEMKTLMTGVVNRIHTFLARTLFSVSEDKAFQKPWTEPPHPGHRHGMNRNTFRTF